MKKVFNKKNIFFSLMSFLFVMLFLFSFNNIKSYAAQTNYNIGNNAYIDGLPFTDTQTYNSIIGFKPNSYNFVDYTMITGYTGTEYVMKMNLIRYNGSTWETVWTVYNDNNNYNYIFEEIELSRTQIDETSIWISGGEWEYSLYDSDSRYYAFEFELLSEDLQPVINGETAFVTNVDNPISVDEIKSRLTAIDDVDGDISHLIMIDSDNYSLNKNIVGTYHVIFSVTDLSGNKATLDVSVLVRDVTKPIITGKNSYTQSMTSKLSVDTTVKNALSVTDNVDENPSITLHSDNYSSNYNIVGSYIVTYKATDMAGNIGYYDVMVNVIDDVNPTFTGPTKIVKNSTANLSVNDVKAQLSANDNRDGNITSNITILDDNYTGFGHLVGEYTIIFNVTDASGNSNTHTVTIEVRDDIPPVFYTDNYFITVSESITLTNQDIIDLLTATGQIQVTTQTTVTTLTNEYIGNENVIGMYAISYKVSSIDGNEKIVNSVVNVIADDTGDTILDPVEPVDEPWYIDIWNWIVWLFSTIWNWIKSLF